MGTGVMPENEFYDLADSLANSFEHHEIRFHLVPNQFIRFHSDISLEWREVAFARDNISDVPDGRGVYAFAVGINGGGLPPHGYVMYVGQAGDGESSLRQRFKSYFQEQKRPKRRGIHRMLNKWTNVLSFVFAEIEDHSVKLKDIERKLNDALLPPYSRNDFSAEVRDAINAFEN